MPTRASTLTALAFVLSGAGGCAADSASLRTTQGDTVIVRNVAPLVEDTATLSVVMRIGAFEGPPELTFQGVAVFAVGPEGDVYASDTGRDIRHFAADGRFERWVARNGQGPGEVTYVVSLSVASDGTLAAHDWGARRVGLFRPDGSNSSALVNVRPRWGAEDAQFLPDGTLWVGIGRDRTRPPSTTRRPAFARVALDGTLPDTLFVPPYVFAGCPASAGTPVSVGIWDDKREPFLPMVTWTLANDGSLAVGCRAAYSFDLHRPDGSILRIEKPANLVELPAEARSYIELWEDLVALPETLPPYTRVLLPADGRIWVWPSPAPERRELDPNAGPSAGRSYIWNVGERGAFDVFESDGSWLGVVRLPEELHYAGFATEPGIVIRGDTIWGITVDEQDVEYVTRYQVDWPKP